MNERMLELYRQAQVPDTAIDPTNLMPYETTRFSADKFAELIVQECAELCEGEAIFAGMNGRKDASASNCATTIRKHFGVEE